MTAPLASVIISTYNRPGYLQQAIASVLAQTLTDFEVLVCDDASDPAADVPGVIPADPRVVYLPAPGHLGAAANNERGYRIARGHYVAHLDDDDQWTPDYLRRMIEVLEPRPECSLSFCNHLIIDERGQPNLRLTRWGEAKWGRADLAEGVYRPCWDLAVVRRAIPVSHAAVIRREVLADLSGLLQAGHVWDMFISYLAARDGHGAYFIPERLSRYRVGGPRLVTRLETYQGTAYCDRIFLADPHIRIDRSAVSARLSRVSAYWAVALLRLGHPDEARAVLQDVPPGPWATTARTMANVPAGPALARLAAGMARALRQLRFKR